MLADDVGAHQHAALTNHACLQSHSAPMPCPHFRYGATPSNDYSIRNYSNFTSTAPVHAAIHASSSSSSTSNANVVGELSRAIMSTTVLGIVAVGISDKWLPNVF